jgi:DHA1 family tetracycline resistance protein-like MFS transporter
MVLSNVSGPSPLLPLPGAWFYFGAGLFLIAWLVFRRSRIAPPRETDG